MEQIWTRLRHQLSAIPSKYVKIGAGVLLAFLFWCACLHYTDSHQVAIARNLITGEMWLDEKPGLNITAPWTKVVRIDTRPHRVCVSSATRNFNCRLVEFNSVGWKELVQLEGLRYYWWDNRFSFNGGYDEEYRGVDDLLRGYAFDTQSRSFIRVIEQIQ